jgi:hypothetical protein
MVQPPWLCRCDDIREARSLWLSPLGRLQVA